MRRNDRRLDPAAAKELLTQGEYGILSTTDPQGRPYGVPLNFAVIGNTLYFHGALEGRKLDNIRAAGYACFTVVGKAQPLPSKFSTAYESAIAFGPAVLVADEDEKVRALTALVEKYSPAFLQEGHAYIERAKASVAVFKMEIEQLTGKHRV